MEKFQPKVLAAIASAFVAGTFAQGVETRKDGINDTGASETSFENESAIISELQKLNKTMKKIEEDIAKNSMSTTLILMPFRSGRNPRQNGLATVYSPTP